MKGGKMDTRKIEEQIRKCWKKEEKDKFERKKEKTRNIFWIEKKEKKKKENLRT